MKSRTLPSGDAVVVGSRLSRGFNVGCDVVVVGSGSGGCVVAAHLAQAGRRVIVLEEGPYFSPLEYGSFGPTEGIRRLWREAGLLAAFGAGQTPTIALATGRCVGGSSVITGGVCFRIPSHVHHHWAGELGLNNMREGALESAYKDVENHLRTEQVPASMRSYGTRRLVAGAEDLGIQMKPVVRNISGCQGNSQCNSGCPAQAKRSVDVVYLPQALSHGARIVSNALVDRVLVKHRRACGVEGRLIDAATGKTSKRFRVQAPTVVLACGTLHTPLVMQRSGIRHTSLGNHVTVHPAVRVCAQFDDAIDGHVGAMQPVYSDHFSSDGLTIVGVHPPVNVLAATLPGIGPSHRARIRKMRGLASLGGMVHDEGGGSVRRGPGREPVLWYRMAERDLTRVRRLITVLGEIAFAAGAKKVYPPIFGVTGIQTLKQLHRLENAPIDPRRIECMAFHPLGSARMAKDERGGLVSESGSVYGVDGLFVADGSVLPTSIGVNSQIAVLSIATHIAWRILDQTSLKPQPRWGGRKGKWLNKVQWQQVE